LDYSGFSKFFPTSDSVCDRKIEKGKKVANLCKNKREKKLNVKRENLPKSVKVQRKMLSSVNGNNNQSHYINSADYLSPMPATVSCQSFSDDL
jgi:hypothetical protein